LGFCAYRYFVALDKIGAEVKDLPFLPKRHIKRKPKYISEEEQWQKEQKVAPLDPGLG
jgi:hypothetical protein